MFWNKVQPAQYNSINQVINISKRTAHLSLHVRIRKKLAGKGFFMLCKINQPITLTVFDPNHV